MYVDTHIRKQSGHKLGWRRTPIQDSNSCLYGVCVGLPRVPDRDWWRCEVRSGSCLGLVDWSHHLVSQLAVRYSALRVSLFSGLVPGFGQVAVWFVVPRRGRCRSAACDKRARKSRIRESLLPTDPFDCNDIDVVGILGGIGLTLARVPGGVALIFAGAAAGPTIASKAGAC